MGSSTPPPADSPPPPQIGDDQEENDVTNAEDDDDVPLSVDDYDIDGVPFFSFEIAAAVEISNCVDAVAGESSPVIAGEASPVISGDYFAVVEEASPVISGDYYEASPVIGGDDYGAAVAASYLAMDEAVDEEMNFLRSLFSDDM